MINHTEMTFLLCAMQVVPILRAGLVLIEQISTVLPSQVTYHVGLVRNEDTLQVFVLVNKQTMLVEQANWPFVWRAEGSGVGGRRGMRRGGMGIVKGGGREGVHTGTGHQPHALL